MPDPSENRSIGVALLGCGTVGGGVADLLIDDRELLRRRTGIAFDLRHVVVRDPAKGDRRPGLPVSTDAMAAIADPAVDVVVELIGGTGVAAEVVAAALRAGKPVVTANKSLLAARGPELFALARQHRVPIAFEASCGGGIPIIHALVHGLVANRIDALVGIVNGTCNFILTQMTQHGMPYPEALAGAQAAGFAEADPTMTSAAATPPRSWRCWPGWRSTRGCWSRTSASRGSTRSTRSTSAWPASWGTSSSCWRSASGWASSWPCGSTPRWSTPGTCWPT